MRIIEFVAISGCNIRKILKAAFNNILVYLLRTDERMHTDMKPEDLTFLGSDPGAVKFGNFINYYTFHSAKQRANNLDAQMFPGLEHGPILCLDIGCNTGELSQELHTYLKSELYPKLNIHMLAIDIDPLLIKRAQESYGDSNITFIAANVMDDSDHGVIKKYLDSYQRKHFDITFCFSITMWIHINNGDEGLKEFLTFIKTISNTIIVEPQPWHCYRNAQRRMKKSGSTFPLYESLKIRSNVENVIENVLTDNTHIKVYESPNSLWNRRIQSFQRLHS